MPEQQLIVDRRSIAAVAVVFAGLVQFVICLYLAVENFPGDYSFNGHFLSDLGRSDHPSAPFFNTSIIVLGTCLIVFFTNAFRGDGVVGLMLTGTLSAIGLIGIGLTPLNTHFVEHHIFLVLWLGPMLLMVWFSMAVFVRRSAFLAVVAGSALATLTMLYVTSARTDDAPFYQKIVVVAAFFWLAVISYYSMFAAVQQVMAIRFGDDRATQRYLERLETRGMYSQDGRKSGNQYRGR